MNKLTPGVILILISWIVPTILIVKSIQFDQNCGGYLKNAADANSVELASERIGKAVEYIEANGLTEGYTSVLWRTEDENVSYWYSNIKACQKELDSCQDATQLEKSNVLMKVRESLTDNGGKGTDLTLPEGISKYPHNTLWAVLFTVNLLIKMIGWILVVSFFIEEY
jgi:hypothetical protein